MSNLAANTLRIIENSSLPRSSRGALRCELAKELEESGDFVGAQEALGDLWRGVGERPDLEGLDGPAEALTLLRAGALTGWLGSAGQVPGAQERAKDLISESARKFEALGMTKRAAEAQVEAALCYWREGAFDEARVVLRDARARLEGEAGDKQADELRARALLRSAIVEFKSQRFDSALEFLTEAGPLVEAAGHDVLKGKFHGELAVTLKNLAAGGRREEYMDRALLEYAAAAYHFERAGHLRYRARVENNLVMVYLELGKFAEAHEHLDRAEGLFTALGDEGSVAQAHETRARLLLAEGRNAEAERAARSAVEMLRSGGEQAFIAEALTALGTALARQGRDGEARVAFESAAGAAEASGDGEGAARAALAEVEEMGEGLNLAEACDLYLRADRRLAGSEEAGALLRSCARRIIERAGMQSAGAAREEGAVEGQADYSLPEAVRRYEGELIRRALEANGGSVTAAARQLGVAHQTLSAIIRRRHEGLLAGRKPRKRRRAGVIKGRSQP